MSHNFKCRFGWLVGWLVGFDQFLLSQLLDGPLLLAKRAPVVLLDPETHATVVKAVVALAPHNDAILKQT